MRCANLHGCPGAEKTGFLSGFSVVPIREGIIGDDDLLDAPPSLAIAVDKALCINRLDPELIVQFLNLRYLGVAEHDPDALLCQPAE